MERIVSDIPNFYYEMLLLIRTQGVEESSRNGRVLSLQEPLLVRVTRPTMRVLFDPDRNANPFFHVMEFVWMMSGDNTPTWIKMFNARFVEYADPNGVIHGAYGHRWRNHFYRDQILDAVRMLKSDPESRRVVLGMWDPKVDLAAEHNDLPCNTHIYLRIVERGLGPELDMTVCNRSNDMVWGMTGANAVHMTFLQELIAGALPGVSVGHYCVMTNNAHTYLDMEGQDAQTLMSTAGAYYPEGYEETQPPIPLLKFGENHIDFLDKCGDFVNGASSGAGNEWMYHVARPIRDIYLARKAGVLTNAESIVACTEIRDPYWRAACIQWLRRKA